MSSILKALEKVDESQRRRHAGAGGVPKGRGRRPAWLIPAWALGGAAVATLATYALMGGFSRPAAQVAQKTADPVAASAPAAAVVATPVPVAAAPAVRQPQPLQMEVAAPAPTAVSAIKPAAAAKPAAQPATRPATGVPAGKPLQPVAKAAVKPVTQSAARATAPPLTSAQAAARQLSRPMAKANALPGVASQPAPVSQPAVQPAPAVVAPAAVAAPPAQQKSRPEIRVTGIAWQNNSESSFAMVNGRPMRQGNMVDGYKIEQIYEDSVRFSGSKGTSLVVPLGAGEE